MKFNICFLLKRIEELKKKQEQLRIKQSHLQNQCDREIFRMKNKI